MLLLVNFVFTFVSVDVCKKIFGGMKNEREKN